MTFQFLKKKKKKNNVFLKNTVLPPPVSSCLEVPLPLFPPRRGLAGSSTGGIWEKQQKLFKSKHIKLHIFKTKSMGTWQKERVSKLPEQP